MVVAYHVFLSFRGLDTRLGFTGNLYNALNEKGIHTFIDDEELQRGDQTTPALMKAIEESRIAIILLSTNYASSFCLDEPTHILHCSKSTGLLVLLVFYEVNPSDMRHQNCSYGDALAKHKKRKLLDVGSYDGAHMVRSHGMGGIGKATLARAVYNSLIADNFDVDSCYKEVLNHVITYVSGLPLALEVIGSNLTEKSIQNWEDAMDQYERIPPGRIQDILIVSFDALNDEMKSVFLHISCCFNEYRVIEVEHIFGAHYGQNIKPHLDMLVKKSLMKRRWLCYTLHDSIEEIGKQIVKQESPDELGNRSRVWSCEDILDVLEENTKVLDLTVLNFRGCKFLKEIPDVSYFLNLEEITFRYCENLKTVHNSIGFLGKVKILVASGCGKLKNFPPLDLPSLEELQFSSCLSLESFPEIIEKMNNVERLYLNLMLNVVRGYNGCSIMSEVGFAFQVEVSQSGSITKSRDIHFLSGFVISSLLEFFVVFFHLNIMVYQIFDWDDHLLEKGWNHVKLSYKGGKYFRGKAFGIHVMMKEGSMMEDVRFDDQKTKMMENVRFRGPSRKIKLFNSEILPSREN
ncbi:hypothetical protein Fmac_015562 [Flemingia macrophylla]|uniref:TIR domain-containing protein n=1 Tax=Flemingia macrophylla TaxID=520843 RepID=A0ABD1MEW1_9FABA